MDNRTAVSRFIRCGGIRVGAQVRRDCAFPDSVRSRLFSPFSRYLHIILHTAVFADRSRTRESLSASTYTGTRACVGGGQHVPSICSEGFGRPVSIFPSRFSFIGCRLRTGEWKTTREPLARKQFQTLDRNAAEKTGAVYFSSGKRKFQRFVPSLPLNPNSHGDSVIDTSGCEVKCIVEIFSGGRGGDTCNCSWNRIGIFHRFLSAPCSGLIVLGCLSEGI